MNTGAIVAMVIMWVIFIGALSWCLSPRVRNRGGKWED